MNKYEKEVQKELLNNEKEVLEELEKTYEKSLSTIKARISELMGKSDELTQSQVYQLRFQQNLEQQVSAIVELLKQDVKTKTNTYLTSVYENSFIGESYNLSKTYKMNTFVGINQNAVVKTVEKPIEKMTFVDRTNVNMNDFKKAIKNEISRGFATSMSYSQMARNVSLVAEKNMYKAYRIARTEGLRVQSESKLDYNNSLKEKYGADLVKRWDSTLDGVTRPEHQELDGQIKELEEDFECSGGKAQAPGLFGDPAMDCNCRCCVTTLPRWAIDVPLTKLDNANPFKEDGSVNLIDGKDYEEYKKNYYEYLNNIENDDTINIWNDFKSIEEAKNYIYNNYIDSDIDKIKNVESLNTTFKELNNLQNKYPLNKDIYIKNKNLKKAKAQGSYQGINIDISIFNNANNIACVGKDWIEDRNNQINYYKQYLGNLKYKQKPIENAIKKCEEQKKYNCFSISDTYNKTESIKATIAHEYGHVIADQYFGQINKFLANPNFNYYLDNECYKKCMLVSKTYNQAINKRDIYNISYYASTDEQEFFAECFAKKQMGKNLPNYINNMLEEVLKNGK